LANSSIAALGLCIASALAEAVLAGRNVKHTFAALRLPPYSPPVWLWGVIGLLYYTVCFIVLKVVLAEPHHGTVWYLTCSGLLTMLIGNAGWNYVFFRMRDLRASFVWQLCYNSVAVGILVLLLMAFRQVALVFFVYVAYLAYATRWAYQLWQGNRSGREAGEQGDEADEAFGGTRAR
jgi:translocator protein